MSKKNKREWLLEERPAKAISEQPLHNEKANHSVKAPMHLTNKLEKKPEALGLNIQKKWSKETQALIDTFRANKNNLPTIPFVLIFKDTSLAFSLHVNHPALWYNRLEEQIAEGPQGNRSQKGLLQKDLKKLLEHLRLFRDLEEIKNE